ncbi:MAG TPA: protein YgfX [Psychromonas sp.]
MPCSNALKYNISVTTSVYGGVVVFTLYFSLILFLQVIFELTWLSLIFSLFLLIIALFAGKNAYARTYQIKLNDTGKVAVVDANKQVNRGEIGSSSFYNGFCVFIHLQGSASDLSGPTTQKKHPAKFIVIYKDAIKEDEYRLLARLINSGR